jgi:hypothetical protein
MASLDLRVELPAHSLVFTVQIQQDATILDVKQAITSACPGSPKPDGQRLISRGRLLQDAEHVAQIWNVSPLLFLPLAISTIGCNPFVRTFQYFRNRTMCVSCTLLSIRLLGPRPRLVAMMPYHRMMLGRSGSNNNLGLLLPLSHIPFAQPLHSHCQQEPAGRLRWRLSMRNIRPHCLL